ncbi:hypothetical protein NSTC745_02586 [Nostoc sp. DSM 114161]|jgi:hypothetical protein
MRCTTSGIPFFVYQIAKFKIAPYKNLIFETDIVYFAFFEIWHKIVIGLLLGNV